MRKYYFTYADMARDLVTVFGLSESAAKKRIQRWKGWGKLDLLEVDLFFKDGRRYRSIGTHQVIKTPEHLFKKIKR